MDKVRKKLQESVSFISSYLPLVNSHMVEFFSNDLWEAHVPNKIKTEFKEKHWNKENIIDIFLENLEASHSELGRFIQSCSANSLEKNEIIIGIDELQKAFRMNRCSNMDCVNKDKFMSEKKFHEVKKMSELVADLVRTTDATHVIDIGDGKGYLSSYLSLVYKLQVLGLDSSTNLTQGAAERANKLQKRWNSALNKFDIEDEPFNNETPSKTKSIEDTNKRNECYKQIPQTLMFRAVFESFMEHKMGKCIGKGREVGRMRSKCSSFVEYSRKGIKKLGYNIHVSDEEIATFFEKYAPSLQFLEFYFMIRVVLAPVIENIILLDRLLFLQENGIKHSFLVKLFDSYVSPRCYGIVAIRDKQ
ncbi:unnamed protein product [Nezara viridula]|uniref:Methyltransferase domain-containing protein n=1 Tax=Nezara viridula TaxID=85310 RepID=A0A9P0HET5_NEZVI|nr:unnamed protein product [Nezara viridula]